MDKLAIFSHGMESGPWGTKIQALAKVAEQCGYAVESLDYQSTQDPDERVQMLLDLAPKAEQLVLVGSSMGGYVAAVAAEQLDVAGLFLLAPAFYMDRGMQQNPQANARYTRVVHGWGDEVIPVEHAIRYAQQHKAALALLDDGHRLIESLPVIEASFRQFLESLSIG